MKVFYRSVLVLLLGVLTFSSNAQRNCGSMDYLEQQKENDSKREGKIQAIERHTENALANAVRVVNGVITIPTVVHIVYNGSNENISDAQIMTQLDVLNEDFRRLNSDADNTWSQGADSEIEFCLASVDPSGNTTTGITRTSTSVSAFSTNDNMKYNSSGGKDAWPATDYLNIWVCDISGGILGYAQFPGGNPATDGVVIDYQYYGTIGTASAPFHLGRTATHEVGHWLNLRHIWGDGGCSVDDYVSDTPTSDGANYGCATGHVSCSSVDMVQNYMDYSDDACMNLYTDGQKSRMRALFEPGGAKASLLNSNGCGNGVTPTCDDGIQNGDETGIDCGGSCVPCSSTCDGTEVTLTLNFDNYPEETSWSLVSGGVTITSGGTYGSQPDGSTLTQTFCLTDGCYDIIINDSYGDGMCCSYGSGSYSLISEGTTLASGASFSSSETTNFCVSSGPAPTCDDGVMNGDETGIDCGGSCTACVTCDDGLMNGDETGIDCGGSCSACPTCDDGIMNGDETGIDCGGSCSPCVSCNDGILNGDETGIDCGGSCDPCTSCNDGVMNGDETGVDCGGSCDPCVSCNDGIMNGDETGIDCGGSCDPCVSCNDGVMNGDETGVDCGGSCSPCPTCNDGIQNGNETGIDCGGSCTACPTCNDGIQNGDETGIDCGGSCDDCATSCSYVAIDSHNFESGWGIWNDGGSDCRRSHRDANYALGTYCARIRDNTNSSTMTTDNLNLSAYDEITIDFSYYARSMENNEDFWLQASTNGGSSYMTLVSWARGSDFNNNTRYYEQVVITGTFTSNTKFRFRCDASGNSDYVYLDDIVITGCLNSAREGSEVVEEESIVAQPLTLASSTSTIDELFLFPNPVKDELWVEFNLNIDSKVTLIITDMSGKIIEQQNLETNLGRNKLHLNSSSYSPGVYFIHLNSSEGIMSKRFIVIE